METRLPIRESSRSLNLDHGTDLATEEDDMPIDRPTHAHGQGYTDLSFLIPELVVDLHYKKAPYFADWLAATDVCKLCGKKWPDTEHYYAFGLARTESFSHPKTN
jgi:hypothetical protein